MSLGDRIFPSDRVWRYVVLIRLLIPSTIGLIWLLAGNSSQFQAWGSAIVALAIVEISVTRSKFEATYRDWIIERLSFQLNRYEARQVMNDKRLDLTVDILTSQVVQILKEIGAPDPWKMSDEEIRDLVDSTNKRREENDHIEAYQRADGAATDYESSFLEFRKRFTPWIGFYWRVEVFLIVFGTLQWGYGDQVFELIYSSPQVSSFIVDDLRPILGL